MPWIIFNLWHCFCLSNPLWMQMPFFPMLRTRLCVWVQSLKDTVVIFSPIGAKENSCQWDWATRQIAHSVEASHAIFRAGTFTLESVPPPTHFSSTMHFLHPATNQTPSASVSFSPPARNSNRKRCGAASSLKTNKQHNTTEPSHGESLGMDYLSLNTHTTSSISLFSSQRVLFCDPNYNSQLGGWKIKVHTGEQENVKTRELNVFVNAGGGKWHSETIEAQRPTLRLSIIQFKKRELQMM